MRNLKRALSLLLAAAMLIGMMVVGASAVSYNDFSDRGEIVNKDAVSMLTTLEIIQGQPDGSYNPSGNVDRAQMAKMISVMLTNNQNCDTLYTNVDSGLTDIAANWARGFINYCYVRGIIAGRGDNTFDPSANVTGVEAAKMLLAALGYNAEIEGLVGPDWALNTAALAQQLGIFRNFTKDVSEPLNRDDAALLIYNALDVELIQEYRNGYAISYDDHRTILSSVFGVIRVEGVVIGNEWAQLEETDSDAALQAGRTRLEDVVWYDSTTANTVVDEGVEVTEPVTFNVATPVDYMGKAVTLYVEKTTVLSNSKVIGVATKDDMNVVVTNASNKTEAKDLLDGTGVSVDKDTQYYVNYGYQTRAKALELINNYAWNEKGTKFDLNGVEVEVIDNNNDGTAEYVLYTRETLSNVVRTSSKDETVTINMPVLDGADLLNRTGSNPNYVYSTTQVIDNADIVTDLELAADDLILYVQYGGRTYITAPEIVTDTMTRVDRDKNNEQYITLSSGETYKMSYIREVLSLVDADVTRFEISTGKSTNADFDTNYEWILDSNGYIVDFRPADDVVKNYGLVLDSAWTQNALTKSGEVKILTVDAVEQTYTINWSACVGKDKPFANDDALKLYLGTTDVNRPNPGDPANYDLGAARGTVIEYTLNEAGDRLTITNVLNLNTLGSDYGLKDATDEVKGNITIDVDGNAYAYMEKSQTNTVTRTSNNLQYTLTQNYDTGDGNLFVSYTNPDTNRVENKTFAIDKNTIAFYYDVVEKEDLQVGGRYYEYRNTYKDGDVLYGVATGWDQMGDVKNATNQDAKVQVYPVITKQGGTYTASNLANVVLFNYELTTDTADWMLVLNANAVNSSTLELNVVFEDGTTAAVEVDRDDYDYFYQNNNAYMKAYKYAVNAKGEYTINVNSAVSSTPASLLRDGTLDTNSSYQYLTITGDSKIWDVTDVDSAQDDVVAGSFDYANAKNAVIIPTNNNRTLKTAWVWDMDGDGIYGTSCAFDWNLTNYETVWAPSGGTSSWVDYMVWTQIRDAFDAGKNVMIIGDAVLGYNINIPAGLTLQVQGDLTTSNAGNVTGAGSLRVYGTFKANTSINVNTQALDLVTADNISINNDTHVQNHAQLGNPNVAADGKSIVIAAGTHLCARNTNNGSTALDAYDFVENKGHIETTGDAHFHEGGIDVSTNSMVINGDLYLCDTFTVGSTASAGSLTVVGGTVRNYTGHNAGDLVVDNGTVTLTTGSSINMAGDLVVNAGGRITQTYSYNAGNVIAGTVTVINGKVDIYGDLVGTNGVTITGKNASVTADDVNAVAPATIKIDEESYVPGKIAQGTTGIQDPATGDWTYNGNYKETVTPPQPGKVTVSVAVTGEKAQVSSITINGTAGNSASVDENTTAKVGFTVAEGYKATVNGTEYAAGAHVIDVAVATANVTVTINVTKVGTIPPTTDAPGKPGTITGTNKVYTVNIDGDETNTDVLEQQVKDALNTKSAEIGQEVANVAVDLAASSAKAYGADNKLISGVTVTLNKVYSVSLKTKDNVVAWLGATGGVIEATGYANGDGLMEVGKVSGSAPTITVNAAGRATIASVAKDMVLDKGYQVDTTGTATTTTITTAAGTTVPTNNYITLGTELKVDLATTLTAGTKYDLTVNGAVKDTITVTADMAAAGKLTFANFTVDAADSTGKITIKVGVQPTVYTLSIDGGAPITLTAGTGKKVFTSSNGNLAGDYIQVTDTVLWSGNTVEIEDVTPADADYGTYTYAIADSAFSAVTNGALSVTSAAKVTADVGASNQFTEFYVSYGGEVVLDSTNNQYGTVETGIASGYYFAKGCEITFVFDASTANKGAYLTAKVGTETTEIGSALTETSTTASVSVDGYLGKEVTFAIQGKLDSNTSYTTIEALNLTSVPAGVSATWTVNGAPQTVKNSGSTAMSIEVPKGADVTLNGGKFYVKTGTADADASFTSADGGKFEATTTVAMADQYYKLGAVTVAGEETVKGVQISTVTAKATDSTGTFTFVKAGDSVKITVAEGTVPNFDGTVNAQLSSTVATLSGSNFVDAAGELATNTGSAAWGANASGGEITVTFANPSAAEVTFTLTLTAGA